MPFPFLPFGAILALAVLGGAFAIFGAALRLLDRAALSARNTIAPTIVHGLRTWSRQPDIPRPISASAMEANDPSSPLNLDAWNAAVDSALPVAVPTERVRRR
jgi:hypothetical protein